MSNRIAQFWTDIDTLLVASSARAVSESQRLAAAPFDRTQPLELYLDRRYLRAALGISIKQMGRHLAALATDHPEVRQQLAEEIARRDAFMRWLAADAQSNVYVRMYPAAEYPDAQPSDA